MSNFETLRDEIYEDLQHRGTRTLTLVKKAIPAALRQLARYRVLFMEKDFSFNSSVGLASAYGGSPSGFPLDVQQIDELWYELGTTNPVRYPIPVSTSLKDVLYDHYNTATLGRAKVAVWHGTVERGTDDFQGKLLFAPAWDEILPVKGLYYRDARRDDTTGELIVEASTTATNPWFTEGAMCLKALTFSLVFANPYLRNEAAAAPQIAVYQAELARFRSEVFQKKGYSAQAERYFDGPEPTAADVIGIFGG